MRRATAPLRERVERLEAEIAGTETRVAELEAALSDPTIYGDPERAASCARERAELGRRIAELNAEWEEAATELEGMEQELARELVEEQR
jgi:ATP-binding cassette subfamily F protein 3